MIKTEAGRKINPTLKSKTNSKDKEINALII